MTAEPSEVSLVSFLVATSTTQRSLSRVKAIFVESGENVRLTAPSGLNGRLCLVSAGRSTPSFLSPVTTSTEKSPFPPFLKPKATSLSPIHL